MIESPKSKRNKSKGRKIGQGVADIAATTFGAFNPVGGEATIWQMMSPTIFDPIVQWLENKDFAGRPLRPMQVGFGSLPKPEYTMHWSSVSGPSKALAKWLNDVSGGSEVRPGKIDVSPEMFDLLYEFVSGGLGRFVANTAEVAYRGLVSGEEIPSNRIPFVRKLYSERAEYLDTSAYEEAKIDVGYARAEHDAAEAAGDQQTLDALWKQYGPQIEISGELKRTESALTRLRKERRALRKLVERGEAEKAEIDDIEAQMNALRVDFNKIYQAEVMGRSSAGR